MEDNIFLTLLKDSPETLPYIIKSMGEKYRPVIYIAAKELFEVWKKLVNNNEYYAIMAEHNKKRMDAYLAAGFSRDEAMMLLLNDNISLKNAFKGTSIKLKND